MRDLSSSTNKSTFDSGVKHHPKTGRWSSRPNQRTLDLGPKEYKKPCIGRTGAFWNYPSAECYSARIHPDRFISSANRLQRRDSEIFREDQHLDSTTMTSRQPLTVVKVLESISKSLRISERRAKLLIVFESQSVNQR